MKITKEQLYWRYPGERFPRRIYYKKIIGPDLHEIQMSDAIFDEKDYKLRKLPISPEVMDVMKENTQFYRIRNTYDLEF